MRIRTVKPEFWIDPKISKLCRDARLLFIGMWSVSDDHGVCGANFEFLKGQLFPYDKIPGKKFSKWINEILGQKLIIPFEANGDKYFYIKNFKKHQVVNKPSKFRNPAPPTLPEQSGNDTGLLPVGGVRVMEGLGRGGVKEQEKERECEGEGKPKGPSSSSEEQTQNRKPLSLSPKTLNPRLRGISEVLDSFFHFNDHVRFAGYTGSQTQMRCLFEGLKAEVASKPKFTELDMERFINNRVEAA